MKIKLPWKSRQCLKDEIEHLQEQLSIISKEHSKAAACNRQLSKQIDDLYNSNIELMGEIEAMEQQQNEVEKLQEQVKNLTAINHGLISNVKELKDRNCRLAVKIRQLEEKSNTYSNGKKGGKR